MQLISSWEDFSRHPHASAPIGTVGHLVKVRAQNACKNKPQDVAEGVQETKYYTPVKIDVSSDPHWTSLDIAHSKSV